MAANSVAAAADLPPLCDPSVDMHGPTPTSNWVISGKLIAGAYPGSPKQDKHRDTIKAVINSGERCILNAI